MEKKYKTLSEFKKDYPKEYNYLKYKKLVVKLCEDMGWKYNKLRPVGYWKIKENVIAEARKYKTRSEWGRGLNGGGSSYEAAKRNGWFDECVAHMEYAQTPANYWTLERCMEEARKYKTKAEWYNNSNRSYIAALKRNFFDECSSHMVEVRRPNGYWNVKENVISEASIKLGLNGLLMVHVMKLLSVTDGLMNVLPIWNMLTPQLIIGLKKKY
jgi:hypothetical protein